MRCLWSMDIPVHVREAVEFENILVVYFSYKMTIIKMFVELDPNYLSTSRHSMSQGKSQLHCLLGYNSSCFIKIPNHSICACWLM